MYITGESMKTLILGLLIFVLPSLAQAESVYDFKVKTMEGTDKSLADYKGKVFLIVNTASHCGYTPQYTNLEKLYERYKDRGFEVLAFPANDFLDQEPGDDSAI